MTAKAEALSAAVSLTYDGETYSIPPASEWDLDVLEHFEEGRVLALVKALLGPDGWARFRSKPRTVADLTDLMESVQEALGAGN